MLNKMNEVMYYIENHLIEELELEEIVPQITGEPLSQFKKIFLFMTNISLLEYIRKRRLTLAGYDLRERKMKVIDVAIKYGYNSPDSFTKTFYKFHQVTPSEVREKYIQIKSFAPIYFQMTISGGTPMNYRIENKTAFKIVGIKKRIPFITEGEHEDIVAIKESIDDNTSDKLTMLSNLKPFGGYSAVYNISENDKENELHCDFLLGTLTTKDDVLGLNYLHVPESTWAIFTSEKNNQQHLQQIWKKIYTEWLPSSEYSLVKNGINIFFMENEGIDNPLTKKEIWVQVQKK